MKLRKRYWFMISIGGVILLLILFFLIFSHNDLDPENYKDNPELYRLANDFLNQDLNLLFAQSGFPCDPNYDFIELSKDPRSFDVLIAIIHDNPSYFNFIEQELSFSDLKNPKRISSRWKSYSNRIISERASFIEKLVIFGKSDKRIYPTLIKILNSEDFIYHLYAIIALGKLGDKRAVEPLLKLLKDYNPSIRRLSAEALGKLEDRRAIEPLEELLKVEKDRYIKEEIEKALKALKASQ